MQIDQLTKLVMTRDIKKIEKSLQELEYEDASKNKKYRGFPIAQIVKGAEQSTEWTQSADGKHEYKGSIFTGVDGAEDVEFLILQINQINKKKDMSIPFQMHIYFKAEAKKSL